MEGRSPRPVVPGRRQAVNDIIDVLINNFKDGKSLREIRQDYEALQEMIVRERSASGEESRRLAVLNVPAEFQLKLVLEKLAENPDKGGESTAKTT